MKKTRTSTYRKITRAAYLLGVIFLLAGMMLSMINQPVAASTPARPTRGVEPPVVRTPEGPGPSNPSEPQPPSSNNPDNPGVPAQRIPGRNVESFGLSEKLAPLAPTPPIRLMDEHIGSVRFTQSNYCLSQAEPGWVSATVVVTLPEGVEATLSTDWYVVYPDPDPTLPGSTEHHYVNYPNAEHPEPIRNGSRVTFEAWWPGTSFWPNAENRPVEIHWGAQLLSLSTGGDISPGAGLDAFFNGRCDVRPQLVVDHACVDGQLNWTVTNPGGTAVHYDYTLTDGQTGSGTVAAGGTDTFAYTPGGVFTATVTWDDGVGRSVSSSSTSELGECQAIPALTITHACRDGGVVFTVNNPGSTDVTFNYVLDGTPGIATVLAGQDYDFAPQSIASGHTVSIDWPDSIGGTGIASDSSLPYECGEVAVQLTHECILGVGGIQWYATNTGTAPASFDWSLDAGALTGRINALEVGATVALTTSSGGIHDLRADWTGGFATDESRLGECGAPDNPQLTIQATCLVEGGGIQWTVSNAANGQRIRFGWSLDGSPIADGGFIEAGQTVNVTTSSGGAHLLTVTYGGESISYRSSDTDCGGQNRLSITNTCIEGGGIWWNVTNNSSQPITFSWDLDNSAQTGEDVTVGANNTLTQVARSSGGQHTFSIRWTGGSTSITSTPTTCNPQPVVLLMDWRCSEDNTEIEWFVINRNPEAVTFRWSDGEEGDTGTVPGNTEMYIFYRFAKDNTSHTVTVAWEDEIATYEISDFNPANACNAVVTSELTINYRCLTEERLEWTVTNSSNVEVPFTWSRDGDAQTGENSIGPRGTKVFLTTSNGPHTVTINWGDRRSFSRISTRRNCTITTVTPTPNTPTPTLVTGTPGTGTPITTGTPGTLTGTPGIPQTGGTPIPTLGAPGNQSASAGNQISPLTGGDFTGLAGAALWQRMLTNLGLLFLGLAVMLSAFASRMK